MSEGHAVALGEYESTTGRVLSTPKLYVRVESAFPALSTAYPSTLYQPSVANERVVVPLAVVVQAPPLTRYETFARPLAPSLALMARVTLPLHQPLGKHVPVEVRV